MPDVKILLTNDDGVRADGLAVLASQLAGLGEIYVVAPDRERSCTGHAFTLNEPLRVQRVAPRWFAVSGTPADCVYLGVLELCQRPDLVISGINHDYNLGTDVFYSGTVAGAVEAALRGVPAIAVSMGYAPGVDFSRAARLCRALAQTVFAEGLPSQTILNINVPGPMHVVAGVSEQAFMWTRLGQRNYREHVDSRTDPRGNTYYWIGGPANPCEDPVGTDSYAIHQGMASISPLHLDLTHGPLLQKLPNWNIAGFESAHS